MKQSRNKVNRNIFRGCLRLFDPCIYLKKKGKCRIAVEKISYRTGAFSLRNCRLVYSRQTDSTGGREIYTF